MPATRRLSFYILISFLFAEFRGDAYKELEVDAGHGTRQHRQIVLIEEVVHSQFQTYLTEKSSHKL